MSDPSIHVTPARPGTACLGCRRRKLKCTKGSPCSNCAKADLPCIYTSQDGSVKRKRGPYNKKKSARERHLEDVVRYLGATPGSIDSAAHQQSAVPPDKDAGAEIQQEQPRMPDTLDNDGERDQLVRDALTALAGPNAEDDKPAHETMPLPSSEVATAAGDGLGYPVLDPPTVHMMRYLHLFRTRFDPLTKLVHWPTFSEWVVGRVHGGPILNNGQRALVLSVYFAAITSCSVNEVSSLFGADKDDLLERYGYAIEGIFSQCAEAPGMEAMQALLIYVTCLRRTNHDSDSWMLFSLGVRMAQLVGLDKDPGATCLPLEAETRRKLWWSLCGLESRSAEEGNLKTSSIVGTADVRLPLNLNDNDLNPDVKAMPRPRIGVTDMSFLLFRWQNMSVMNRVWNLRRQHALSSDHGPTADVVTGQRRLLDKFKNEWQAIFKDHYSSTRPLDWMIMTGAELMWLKSEMLVETPDGGLVGYLMNPEQRLQSLRNCARVLALTNAMSTDPRVRSLHWFFRQFTQWHALAVVVTDLSESRDTEFITKAWSAVNPILRNWDQLFEGRKQEPAWDHVNRLIDRARRRKAEIEKNKDSEGYTNQDLSNPSRSPYQKRSNSQSAVSDHFTNFATGMNDLRTRYTDLEPRYTVPDSDYLDSGTLTAGPKSAGDSQPPNVDPFAEFDPTAFEEVFSTIDWDSLGPIDNLIGDVTASMSGSPNVVADCIYRASRT